MCYHLFSGPLSTIHVLKTAGTPTSHSLRSGKAALQESVGVCVCVLKDHTSHRCYPDHTPSVRKPDCLKSQQTRMFLNHLRISDGVGEFLVLIKSRNQQKRGRACRRSPGADSAGEAGAPEWRLLNLNERRETGGYTTRNPPEKFRLGD